MCGPVPHMTGAAATPMAATACYAVPESAVDGILDDLESTCGPFLRMGNPRG